MGKQQRKAVVIKVVILNDGNIREKGFCFVNVSKQNIIKVLQEKDYSVHLLRILEHLSHIAG